MHRIFVCLAWVAVLVEAVSAAPFTAQRIESPRQFWFLAPLDQPKTYRIIVISLTDDDVPKKAIIASAAQYSARGWTILRGREISFVPGTLEPEPRSIPLIAGFREDLRLNLEAVDHESSFSRFGEAWLFSLKKDQQLHTNASIFISKDVQQPCRYIFARRAIFRGDDLDDGMVLEGCLVITCWSDDHVPEMLTVAKIDLPSKRLNKFPMPAPSAAH